MLLVFVAKKTTVYHYNMLDQLTEVYDNGIRQALYEYGADGNLIRQTIGEDLITEYSYDADHNLTALKTTLAGMKKPYAENSSILPIASGITLPTTALPYTENNCSLTQGIASNPLTTENTRENLIGKNLVRENLALPQEKAFHPEALQVLVDNHYTYDGNGNRLTKQTLNGTNTYQFDALNRLIHVAYPTYTEAFRYDGAGNRTQRTILPTPQSQPLNGYHSNVGKAKAMTADTLQNLPRAISQQYSYDATNRLQTILTEENGTTHTEQFTYDKQGNLLQDGRQTYSYDAFNRTVRVETVEGNYQENRYDAEGLRAEMVENGELVKFLFAGREVVAETEADGNVIRYIRGYDLISSDSENAKTYYHYACDEQGSITHLVSGVEWVVENNIATGISDTRQATNTQNIGITNHDKNVSLEDHVLNRYEYDAFGNTMYSEEKLHNRFRYTGQQYDPITQQYYLRARYYNPVIARFTQEDTYHGDGLNLYSYCHNNPLMYYDPSGHDGESCGGAKDNDRLEDEGVENKNGEKSNTLKLEEFTKDVLVNKPKYAPGVTKWYKKGGKISIDDNGVWTYHDWEGNSVSYPNGYPDFKSAGMVQQEVPIGEFKGYDKDFSRADELAPNGPKADENTWHHHQDGTTMQEIDKVLHKRFTHIGGMSGAKK